MRKVIEEQTRLGQVDIAAIKFDLKSRDEIPKLLMGLQHIYCHPEYREKVFKILEEMLPLGIDANNGRPGMSYWKILVLGMLRLNCNWDYDKVKEIADNHITLRQMLGHGIEDEEKRYELQTIIDNVSLFTPEILKKVNKVVVDAGHNLIKKKDEKIKGRCDSFVVETDVHYPTDINLLFDAIRKIIVLLSRLCDSMGVAGWRQYKHLLKKMKRLYRTAQKKNNSLRKSRKYREKKEKERKDAHKIYIDESGEIIRKAKETLNESSGIDISEIAIIDTIKKYIGYGELFISQIRRRVLDGKKIPHDEKIFSIFEEHTEWISKGKAGVPQELGLNVCILEDQYKFILHHEVMEKITDDKIAIPIVEEAKKLFPLLSSVSFDKGFYTPENKLRLIEVLDEAILPKKGKLSEDEKKYESSEEFVLGRRKHSAVESGINALENHGLDRCLDYGIKGFKRYIALAVVARNLQNLGNIIQQKGILKMKKQTKVKYKQAS